MKNVSKDTKIGALIGGIAGVVISIVAGKQFKTSGKIATFDILFALGVTSLSTIFGLITGRIIGNNNNLDKIDIPKNKFVKQMAEKMYGTKQSE